MCDVNNRRIPEGTELLLERRPSGDGDVAQAVSHVLAVKCQDDLRHATVGCCLGQVGEFLERRRPNRERALVVGCHRDHCGRVLRSSLVYQRLLVSDGLHRRAHDCRVLTQEHEGNTALLCKGLNPARCRVGRESVKFHRGQPDLDLIAYPAKDRRVDCFQALHGILIRERRSNLSCEHGSVPELLLMTKHHRLLTDLHGCIARADLHKLHRRCRSVGQFALCLVGYVRAVGECLRL